MLDDDTADAEREAQGGLGRMLEGFTKDARIAPFVDAGEVWMRQARARLALDIGGGKLSEVLRSEAVPPTIVATCRTHAVLNSARIACRS